MNCQKLPWMVVAIGTIAALTGRSLADSLVAVTLSNGDIDEYYVAKGTFNANATWTKARTIINLPNVHGIAYNSTDGNFYTTTSAAPVKISKVTRAGVETVLATRGVSTTGWTDSNSNGIQIGPDGKIYFTTAFGAAGTNGVFSLQTNGTGFTQFIAPSAASLGAARDLLWDNSFLYVTSRTANAVYKFNSSGVLQSTLTTACTGASFLGKDGTTLMVGTNQATGPNAIRKIDAFATAPVLGSLTATGKVNAFALEVIEGQRHYVTFNAGTGGAADIDRLNTDGSSTVIVTFNTPTIRTANDFVVYPPVDTDGDGLSDAWEISKFGNLAQGASDNISDADGLTNLQEYLAGTDPTKTDTDNDGLSDSAEVNRMVSGSPAPTNPTLADTDGDGLIDSAETNTGVLVSAADTGTNPLLADTDGDTFKDYVEIARSSNPFLNTSTPGASSTAPIVSLSASALSAGPLSAWPNTGTIGSTFNSGATQPVVSLIRGVKGVTFTGSESLTGVAAPPVLTGNSARTITAWVLNPTTETEETIVGWGRRDGPNSTFCALGHGTSTQFGAVAQWGADADMGWGSSGNVKKNLWTYLVYTYEPATKVGTVYVDGVQANQETFAAVLNTWGVDNTLAAKPLPLRVAANNAADGTIASTGAATTLTIANMKIYDRVATSADLGFTDTDGDTIPDWYEVFYGMNPAVNDAGLDLDGDTLTNLAEFTLGTNPAFNDTDGDGLRDNYETNDFTYLSPTSTGTNPLLADSDGDGLSDGVEKYTGVYVSTSNTGTDPNAFDTDGDGISDGLEVLTYGTDPNSDADKDSDGLLDREEIFTYHTNPSLADTDGDSYGDQVEINATSDPNDPISTPTNIVGYSGTLIHRFKLDETSGTVSTDSESVTTAAIGSDVLIGQSGRDGKSYLFPAVSTVNSKVLIPTSVVPATTAPFTMTAWVRLTAPIGNGGQSQIISGNDGNAGRWNLGINDFDAAATVDAELFWFHNGGLNSVPLTGFNFNDHINEWVHVAVTRSSTGLTTLYLNGAGTNIGTSKATLNPGVGIALGARPNAIQFQLTGNIDDVRFYDGGLSPANVLSLYNSYVSLYDMWAGGFGLDPNGNGAPGADADGDGTINQIEYLLGLIPNNGASRFAVTSTGNPSTGITLTWPSQPGINFTVKSSLALDSFGTIEAAVVPAAASPATTTSWTSPPLADPRKFFRVEFQH
ncbi:MAG: binary toxin-like calcium binding domain-containing protein [Luteolibacter sp.]|uniref:binary toxin-like calcium binding domain-containing protein n=1 Tax=Luteolibacter sp. TaxID=1962973 RepID=UPI0032659585